MSFDPILLQQNDTTINKPSHYTSGLPRRTETRPKCRIEGQRFTHVSSLFYFPISRTIPYAGPCIKLHLSRNYIGSGDRP